MIVVDASVAVKWYLAEANSDIAQRLIGDAYELVAPDLLHLEVANALYKAWRRGAIDIAHMNASMTNLRSTPIRIVSMGDFLVDATRMAQTIRHPVYDCVYLVLALRLAGRLITADESFINALGRTDLAHAMVSLREA